MGNRPAVLGSWEINRKERKPFWRVVELSVLLLAVVTMSLMFTKTHRTKHEQEQIYRM